nr:Imm51 family immunity protein [Methylomonas fluvii]
MDSGEYRSLILSDQHMVEKTHIFDERADEGWNGNGYDWNSIAQVILFEQLPDLQDELDFDPEAGMFSTQGSRSALERLGKAMSLAFHNEEVLRDLLSRAELD